MGSDRRIVIGPDKTFVVAENGPMRLVIRGFCRDRFQMEPALDTAQFAFSCLEQVAGDLSTLKGLTDTGHLQPISQNMCASVQGVGDADLTPMASVAGAIADAVADHLFEALRNTHQDIKVIVDNGGDLAIRLAGDENARVGLRTDLNTTELSHTMALSSAMPAYGVNTSGMGGRSFTRGIASAATVLAADSCTADAAATAVANACYHEDENIVQVPAGQLDPATDIPHIPVTVQAAGLSPSTVQKALTAALEKAERLKGRGLIYGAFIVCGGRLVQTRHFDHALITPRPGNPLSEL